ncbi:thioredoxin fold domain-containing protein [Sulfurospirillum sp. 1307]|jgi:thioredoxin-related protein
MIKTFSKVFGLLLVALFIFSGCEEKTVVSDTKPKVLQKENTHEQGKIETHAAKKIEQTKKSTINNPLSEISRDNAKISSGGQYGLIIFESINCKYCDKLKSDLAKNNDLKNRLQNDFAVFDLSVDSNSMHQLEHQGEFTTVDTKTLIDIYGVQATPTLVFTDKQTKSIFIVPGYMGPKQFKVTLDFIESKKWQGLDRKNGDVYKELKKYYIEKGIIKG